MPTSSESDSDENGVFQSHFHAHSHSSSSSSSRSISPPPLPHPTTAPNFFAPPFYNRPPTPLPPSPSLTSLLRPSRPTTPDSSGDDLEPVPRASPKVPTYEYYGFVLYLFSSLTFLMYLLWSYLPSAFLGKLGIYYYPNRWWSLALPSWIVMGLCYVYVALAAYNTGYLTLGLGDLGTVVDEAANVAVLEGKWRGRTKGPGVRRESRKAELGKERDVREWKHIWSQGTDAVMDVPLGGVCEILYGAGRDHSEDEDGF